jgi:hypothetical protein
VVALATSTQTFDGFQDLALKIDQYVYIPTFAGVRNLEAGLNVSLLVFRLVPTKKARHERNSLISSVGDPHNRNVTALEYAERGHWRL